MDSIGIFVVENVRFKIVELIKFTETLKGVLFGTNVCIVSYKNISRLCIYLTIIWLFNAHINQLLVQSGKKF